MGLPIGWTMPSCVTPWTIGPTSSDCWVMEWSPTQQRELSVSCGEISTNADERTVYLTPHEEFDGALLRIEEGVAVYSAERVIEVYMNRGMSEDDARDYFLYNCEGVHVGPFTPRYEWQEFDE